MLARRLLVACSILVLVLALPGAVAGAGDVEIGGRVVAAGMKPLAEAAVSLEPLVDPLRASGEASDGSAGEPVARARTDESGRFRLAAPRPGLWIVRVELPGFVPLVHRLEPLIEPVELADAVLEPDVGLTVRAVNPARAPLPAASVEVAFDARRTAFAPAWTVPCRRARTDAAGVARLPHAESESVNVSVSAPGYLHEERKGLRGSAATFELSPGPPRTFVVRGADARPVAGAWIAAAHKQHARARTDEGGRAELVLRWDEPTAMVVLARDGRRLETRIYPPLSVAGGPHAGRELEPVQLTLPDRVVLGGRLIDAASRGPIPSGLVWNANDPSEVAVTDEQGAFAIGGPPASRLALTAGAPGYLGGAHEAVQLVADGRAGPTLALEPGATIAGRVVGPGDRPVEGAEVRVEERREDSGMRFVFGRGAQLPRARSGAGGTFRIGPVDPGLRYTVEARAQGFAPAGVPVAGLEPRRVASGVRIELGRGRAVTGTLVDGEGRAIREVALSLAPAERARGPMQRGGADPGRRFTAASDGDGRFAIAGVPAGTFDLTARRAGFATRTTRGVEIASGDEPVDLGSLVLEPGQTVQGFVLDRSGQPVEGAEVRVEEDAGPQLVGMGPGTSAREPDAVTDARGWFRVVDRPAAEPFGLQAHRTGFIDAVARGIALPRQEPVELVLDPASDISGRVADRQARPIAGAEVGLKRIRTIERGGDTMAFMSRETQTTDAEGRFLFEDQVPGKIALSATASGWQEAVLNDLEVPKGADLSNVSLELDAGSILEGRVIAPDGRPAIGVRVGVVEASDGPFRSMGGDPTDGDGRYRLEGLAPGTVSIQAEHEDHPRAVRDIELREGPNRLDLQLSGGQEIAGLVVDDAGAPVAGALVRLARRPRVWGGPEARAGGDGRFSITGVQDGDYELLAEAEGFAPAGAMPIQVAGAPLADIEIQLVPGGSIVGTIRGIAPEELGRVLVEAQGPQGGGRGREGLDRKGEYRLEHLPPGSYEVVATLAGSARQARGQVELPAGVELARLDLELAGGHVLSGRAHHGGVAVAGATISVEGLDVNASGWSETDDRGRFAIDGLEAGRYRLRLQDLRGGLSHSRTIDLATDREIELAVPTASVRGSVLDEADGQPLAGVRLTLETEDPGARELMFPAHSATTDTTGRFTLPSVAAGAWKLSADRKGYAALSRAVTVPEGSDGDDLRLRMAPTEGLTVEARLPGGGLPDELRIAVLDAGGGAVVGGTYATGENGRVRLGTVPPGSWEILVAAQGSAAASVRGQAPGTVPLDLPPACRLTLHVPELSQTAILATVTLTDVAGQVYRALDWIGRPAAEWPLSNGRMEFGALPPGTWVVHVRAPDGRSWEGRASTSAGAPAQLELR